MSTQFKPLVSDATLRRVYDNMVQARLLDDALARNRRAHSVATGQRSEAIDAVVLDGLKSRDLVITLHSRPSAALLRGEDPGSLIDAATHKGAAASEIKQSKGVVKFAGTASEMASFAAGCARAMQRKDAGDKGVQPAVVALLGFVGSLTEIDGSLRAISAEDLPVILVAHTAEGVSLEIAREKMRGVPNLPVDASDAVALMRCAQESLLRVRTGLGGVMINARVLPGAMDPLVALETHMRRKNIFREKESAAAQARFAKQLERATRPRG